MFAITTDNLVTVRKKVETEVLAKKKAAGAIIFTHNGEVTEVVTYKTAEDFIDSLRREINKLGIMGYSACVHYVYNRNNLDLDYEVYKREVGEFVDYVMSKKQYIIEKLSPEFEMQKKLSAIQIDDEYYGRTASVHGEYKKVIDERIADAMSTKALKKWVNRRYNAIK